MTDTLPTGINIVIFIFIFYSLDACSRHLSDLMPLVLPLGVVSLICFLNLGTIFLLQVAPTTRDEKMNLCRMYLESFQRAQLESQNNTDIGILFELLAGMRDVLQTDITVRFIYPKLHPRCGQLYQTNLLLHVSSKP
jgi:hypothetical protein